MAIAALGGMLFRRTPRRLAYSLPQLLYPLEEGIPPTISQHQLHLHYNMHHKAYVDKLNVMTEGTPRADKPLEHLIREVNDGKNPVLFNQAAQHYNHSFYWKCMRPNGSDVPPTIGKAIEATFGSLDTFKQKFEESAIANFGSGWTWLICDTKDKKLSIVNTGNAGTPIIAENAQPLLTVDVW
eukprot:385266_1